MKLNVGTFHFLFCISLILLFSASSLYGDYSNPLDRSTLEEKTQVVAQEIERYIRSHPSATIKMLQNDPTFENLAVQRIGKYGYTGVVDARTGYFYFHPQKKLVNTDSHALKEQLPDWWNIFAQIIEKGQDETYGTYVWRELDGSLTHKNMYLKRLDTLTADGVELFVAGTAYHDESIATRLLERYKVQIPFSYAKKVIEQKAHDVAKQIEIYVNAHPTKTVADLQNDQYFKSIAVQRVGEKGYTVLFDNQNFITYFHVDPQLLNHKMEEVFKKNKHLWSLIMASKNGNEVGGAYIYREENGKVQQKYVHIVGVNAQTHDGVRFNVAATVYLDEYRQTDVESRVHYTDEHQLDIAAEQQSITLGQLSLLIIILSTIIVLFLIHFRFIATTRKNVVVLMIVFVCVLFSAFAIIVWQSIEQMRVETIKQKAEKNRVIIMSKTILMQDKFAQFQQDLLFLAHAIRLYDPKGSFTTQELKRLYQQNEEFVYASYRIDCEGTIANMFPVDEKSLGVDISYQDHMREITAHLRPVISNVFMAVEGFPAITIHVPVLKDNQYDGTVAYLINLKTLGNMFFGESEALFDYLYLIDANQKILYSHNFEQATLNFAEIIKAENFDEEDMLQVTYSFFVVNKIWQIITIDNKAQMAESLDAYAFKQWWTLFLLYVVIIIMGMVFLEILTRSLSNEVAEKTRELSFATEKAQQLAEQAQKANRAKSEFLANMSHEIRTPMNAIVGFSQLLAKSAIDETQKEYVTTICEAGDVLLGLIENILDITKIEAGHIVLDEVDFEIEESVRHVIRIVNITMKNPHVRLEYSISSDLPRYVRGDATRFSQILINLIGNAIKFTKEGVVKVGVFLDDTRHNDSGEAIHIVRVSVKDAGRGIPASKLQYIFETFAQVDTSSTRRYEGTGLGLSIAKLLVEKMGGMIEVHSEEKKGSEFIFTVKFKQTDGASVSKKWQFADAQKLSTGAQKEAQLYKKMHVLVVEDNEINRKLITIFLKKLGCTYDTTDNGYEAIEKVKERSYDAILMDLQMPKMSGIDAAKTIRSSAKNKTLPIIAITAAATKEDKRMALESGFDEFLTKPIAFDQFRDCLVKYSKKI